MPNGPLRSSSAKQLTGLRSIEHQSAVTLKHDEWDDTDSVYDDVVEARENGTTPSGHIPATAPPMAQAIWS